MKTNGFHKLLGLAISRVGTGGLPIMRESTLKCSNHSSTLRTNKVEASFVTPISGQKRVAQLPPIYDAYGLSNQHLK